MRPADFEPLSLGKDAVDRYYGLEKLAEVGLSVVVSKTVASGKVYIIDPSVIDLYLSPVVFEANSSTWRRTAPWRVFRDWRSRSLSREPAS